MFVATRKRKRVLIVGGKPEMRDLVRKTAVDVSMPYVAGRWLGGTLTITRK